MLPWVVSSRWRHEPREGGEEIVVSLFLKSRDRLIRSIVPQAVLTFPDKFGGTGSCFANPVAVPPSVLAKGSWCYYCYPWPSDIVYRDIAAGVFERISTRLRSCLRIRRKIIKKKPSAVRSKISSKLTYILASCVTLRPHVLRVIHDRHICIAARLIVFSPLQVFLQNAKRAYHPVLSDPTPSRPVLDRPPSVSFVHRAWF